MAGGGHTAGKRIDSCLLYSSGQETEFNRNWVGSDLSSLSSSSKAPPPAQSPSPGPQLRAKELIQPVILLGLGEASDATQA